MPYKGFPPSPLSYFVPIVKQNIIIILAFASELIQLFPEANKVWYNLQKVTFVLSFFSETSWLIICASEKQKAYYLTFDSLENLLTKR